jgi:hypothetical protein
VWFLLESVVWVWWLEECLPVSWLGRPICFLGSY